MASVFLVAATVLAIVNGQPVHPFPDGDVRYDITHQYPTMKDCQNWHRSDAFRLQKEALAAQVLAAIGEEAGSITITEACHEFVPGGPNGNLRDKTAEEGSF